MNEVESAIGNRQSAIPAHLALRSVARCSSSSHSSARPSPAPCPPRSCSCLWWKRGSIDAARRGAAVPFFVIGIAMGLLTAWLERTHVGGQRAEWDCTFVERCLIAGRAVWFYAREAGLAART